MVCTYISIWPIHLNFLGLETIIHHLVGAYRNLDLIRMQDAAGADGWTQEL